MGLFPKPDQESIRRLALDETDPAEARRFAPLRFGFAGNALIIVIAGAAGLICSAETKP